jgi:hypothetical protein
MPSTLQGITVFALAVLPGALYFLVIEREMGRRWGIGFSDRLIRFVVASAVFQVLYLPALYPLWRAYWHHRVETPGHVRFENRVSDGDIPMLLFAVPFVYIGIPILIAFVAAQIAKGDPQSKKRLSRLLVGRDPAPRAWDFLFGSEPAGYIRARLKNDQDHPWIGGEFGAGSYAAGYPEEPLDIYLEKGFRMTVDGEFERTENDSLVETGSALLIRWEEVDLLEFFRHEGEGNSG